MSTPAHSQEKPATAVDNVTVQDEREVDDLDDDLLDGKRQCRTRTHTCAPTTPYAYATKTCSMPEGDEPLLDDELFAKELTEGMEALLRQMASGNDLPASMEELLRQMPSASTGADKAPTAEAATTSASASAAAEGADRPQNFQDTITETMNRLRNSSQQAKAAAAEADSTEDALMAEMLRQMEQMTETGEFDGLIDGMMGQLMTYDVLYEPMKELAEKYPDYLAEQKATLPAETWKQYEQQYTYVRQIDAATPGDDGAAASVAADPKLSELMQKMQDCGQPPKELLEQLAPGMELNDDGIPNPPDMEQCSVM
ncbi:Pex19 protein family-domain-containing protein [Syncephalis pseudoplumigaleata]|uniref:Pex19 protein family-domain-containing protein n=1 Tax=Syncephalis pseudoplumigaleata TaxID=1712513 RepID=A0A4P9Z365_9FUNG|nr:Pex19 protein family-domain-containing protein [Syncephalis pseudoplumigaleata]|eukprot:RKP26886.1 Pex19 protein family-domain-containing protein [Syncephalis pseudoplumigaleata]